MGHLVSQAISSRRYQNEVVCESKISHNQVALYLEPDRFAQSRNITQLNRIADNGSPCLTPRPQTMGLLLLPFTLRTVDVLSYMWPTYSTNASGTPSLLSDRARV